MAIGRVVAGRARLSPRLPFHRCQCDQHGCIQYRYGTGLRAANSNCARRAFRDLASQAPYEFVEILVNGRTYGGGGIFGQFSTVAADSLWAPYIFVHEFGHHFAALADEYYTSEMANVPTSERVEPWEPNVTALADPTRLKWRDLVAPGTPLPTREAYGVGQVFTYTTQSGSISSLLYAVR